MNVAKNLQLLTSAYDQSHLDKEELAGSITSENFSASSTGSSPASSSSLSVPGWQVVWKEQTFIAEDCNSLKLKLLKFNNNRNITDNDFNPPRVLSPGILEASPAVVGGVAAGTELNFIFKMAPVQTCFVLAAS